MSAFFSQTSVKDGLLFIVLLLQMRLNYRMLGRLNISWNVALGVLSYPVTFVISLVSIYLFLCCSLIYLGGMKLDAYELLTWRLGFRFSCICALCGKLLARRTTLDRRLLSPCRFWTPLVCVDINDSIVPECALCSFIHDTHTFGFGSCQLSPL